MNPAASPRTIWRINRSLLVLLLLTLLAPLAGCESAATATTEGTSVNLFVQWGASNPDYSNVASTVGDSVDTTGTGVLGGPSGEGILLFGEGYQTDSSGAVSILSSDFDIAVAGVMSGFSASASDTTTTPMTCEDDLIDYIEDLIGTDETYTPATFILEGTFDAIAYAAADGVSNDADLTDVSDISGTMVGVKSPYYLGDDSWIVDDNGVSVGIGEYPYHIHFLSNDASVMGHVRTCTIDSGATIDVALVETYQLEIEFGSDE